MKKALKLLALITVPLTLYVLTVRGNLGNPTPDQIEYQLNSAGRPFETSQERSRWALILSLYNNKSFAIDDFASMGTPDIGRIRNHYYSFFPPGTSLLALPLYVLGSQFGASQLAVFSLTSIFTLLTMILMYKFCNRLGMHHSIGLFAALAYGFSTNAWGYSVTLFAHPISAFLLLLGLYLVIFSNNHSLLRACLVWTIYAIAVYIDIPNLFIFLPIVIGLTANMIRITEVGAKIVMDVKLKYLIAPLAFILLMGLHGYYNYIHFGSPFILSNTIPRVRDLKESEKSVPEKDRNAGQALWTRNFLNSLSSILLSHDRSLIVYSPSVLLFLLGLGHLSKKEKGAETLLIAVPATCLVLYSMFGDPYGGWAFGSRYMIAVMPELLILAGIGLQRFDKNIPVKILYTVVFYYSTAVAALAPLTTNVIPPFVEARNLGLDSSYVINWRMLQRNELDSFFYNHILNKKIDGLVYYGIVLALALAPGITLIWLPRKRHDAIDS